MFETQGLGTAEHLSVDHSEYSLKDTSPAGNVKELRGGLLPAEPPDEKIHLVRPYTENLTRGAWISDVEKKSDF